MSQSELFRSHRTDAGESYETARFDGETYDPTKDGPRLGAQLRRVLDLMSDGKWRSLGQISVLADAPAPSVSARLRDLRKPRFGGFTVQRRRVSEDGLWEYRLMEPRKPDGE